jgi:cobalamin 5'-phosphate synthase/cobalamin synthase
MGPFVRSLLAATTFLTRLPPPPGTRVTGEDVARAAPWFPLVGALVGLLSAGLLGTLRALGGHPHPMAPPTALVCAALLMAFDGWLTRALHLDGLADAADGLGGGRTREDTLRIMRDHSVGAFGASALTLLLGVKVAALAALVQRPLGWTLGSMVAAPTLARWTAVLLLRWQPYARATEGAPGIGARIGQTLGPAGVAAATLFALAVSVPLLGGRAVPALVVALSLCGHWGHAGRRRLGGVTGDLVGACVATTEVAVLAVCAL